MQNTIRDIYRIWKWNQKYITNASQNMDIWGFEHGDFEIDKTNISWQIYTEKCTLDNQAFVASLRVEPTEICLSKLRQTCYIFSLKNILHVFTR